MRVVILFVVAILLWASLVSRVAMSGEPHSIHVATHTAQTAPGPSQSDTNAAATAILDYLRSLPSKRDHRLISGQHDQHNDIVSIVPLPKYIQEKTGKWVGIYGANVDTNNVDVLAAITDYWKHGGLVTLVADMVNPTCQLVACSSKLSLSPFTPDDLITSGSAINRQFLRDLDADVVPKLRRLKNSGVVVLFRPMIEMDGFVGNAGCWTWWNCSLDGPHYAALWRQMHDYLVRTKRLDNLLWVMAFNSFQNPRLPATYYPGAPYVDVVGEDIYEDRPSDPQTYRALLAFGKPFGLTEFGPGGASVSSVGTPPNCRAYYDYRQMLTAIRDEFPKAVYWVSWGGCWSMYYQLNAASVLNDPQVVNRDDLPSFRARSRHP